MQTSQHSHGKLLITLDKYILISMSLSLARKVHELQNFCDRSYIVAWPCKLKSLFGIYSIRRVCGVWLSCRPCWNNIWQVVSFACKGSNASPHVYVYIQYMHTSSNREKSKEKWQRRGRKKCILIQYTYWEYIYILESSAALRAALIHSIDR